MVPLSEPPDPGRGERRGRRGRWGRGGREGRGEGGQRGWVTPEGKFSTTSPGARRAGTRQSPLPIPETEMTGPLLSAPVPPPVLCGSRLVTNHTLEPSHSVGGTRVQGRGISPLSFYERRIPTELTSYLGDVFEDLVVRRIHDTRPTMTLRPRYPFAPLTRQKTETGCRTPDSLDRWVWSGRGPSSTGTRARDQAPTPRRHSSH